MNTAHLQSVGLVPKIDPMSLGDELPPAPIRTARVQLIVSAWNDSKVTEGIEIEKRYRGDPNYRELVRTKLHGELDEALERVLFGHEPRESP